MSVKCPKCSSDNTDSASFCSECGTQLGHPKDIPEVTKTIETPFPQFAPGTSLSGRYEIIKEIGKGGMGEVYLAEDTNLKRQVAIKVLPQQFALDKERLARFEREARLLASLNHPNIATIYGLEKSDGQQFLVMELVEGDTLAEQINKGPLPVDEALEVCRQIAEGLESAHETGIIHRDLKPSNVKVTPEGKVKILDFGLAKAFLDQSGDSDLSKSPVITEEMTRPGVILGTAAYMSPEQAKGKTVDKRTDIWAFGCIMFECLTGKRVFKGETISETLASILKDEPDWSALPDSTPLKVQELMKRCLVKDPRNRRHDIADARIEIEETLSSSPVTIKTGAPSTIRFVKWRWALMWGGIGLILGALVLGGIFKIFSRKTLVSRTPAHLMINLPKASPMAIETGEAAMALSPDGRRLAYIGRNKGVKQLFVREMVMQDARMLPGISGVSCPFFSPDGEWIGCFVGNKLKKVSVVDGTIITICEIPKGSYFYFGGASWGSDGKIIFSGPWNSGLWWVPGSGGTPEVLTKPDFDKGYAWHSWPQYLEQSNKVLFTILSSTSFQAKVGLYSFETNEYKIIQNGGYAKYIPTGHLIYTSGRRLYAAPFDLKSDNFTGPPVQIFEDIVMNFPIGDVAYYSFSDTGLLVYARMIPGQSQNRLVWIDWQGTVSPVTEQQRGYRWPRISPDGSKVALTIIEGDEYDVWIYDIKRDTFTQFTFDGDNDLPIWTPDGNWITFNSTREGSWDLFRKRADASGKAEKLSTAKYHHLPTSWSPDGKSLAYTDVSDIWILSLDDERKSQPFIQTPIDEGEARFSPDGRHIAFCTNDSGLFEVNVAAFPGPGGKYQVSKEGGCDPIWNPNGKQLYYRKGNNIMVVDIETESGFLTSKPRVLYEAPYIGGYTDYRSYDITPDGQRFIAVEKTPALTQIDVVLDWFEIIKSRIPSEQNY